MDSSSTSIPPDIPNYDDSNYKYIDGVCFYTDPNTKKEYTWNKEKKTWTEKGFENYEYDEILKTYKYIDKQTSNYVLYTLSNKLLGLTIANSKPVNLTKKLLFLVNYKKR